MNDTREAKECKLSMSAYLVCEAREMKLGLGKPLRGPSGKVIDFADRNEMSTRALWKFVADTAGETIIVTFDSDSDFEIFSGYPEIGGWPEDGGIPFEEYLRDQSAR